MANCLKLQDKARYMEIDSSEYTAHQDLFQLDTVAVIGTPMPESSQTPPGAKRRVRAV